MLLAYNIYYYIIKGYCMYIGEYCPTNIHAIILYYHILIVDNS